MQLLLNVVAGGFTPNFTAKEAEAIGAKLISTFARFVVRFRYYVDIILAFFSLPIDNSRTSNPRHARVVAVAETYWI